MHSSFPQAALLIVLTTCLMLQPFTFLVDTLNLYLNMTKLSRSCAFAALNIA